MLTSCHLAMSRRMLGLVLFIYFFFENSKFCHWGVAVLLRKVDKATYRGPPPERRSTFFDGVFLFRHFSTFFLWSKHVEKCRKMSKDVEKCRKMSKNWKMSKVVKSCRKMSKNVEKCRKMSKDVERCRKMSKNVEKMSKNVDIRSGGDL